MKSLFFAALPVVLAAALLAGAPRTHASIAPSVAELEAATQARVDARLHVHLAQLAAGARADE